MPQTHIDGGDTSKDEENKALMQSGLEYWKTQYDYQKHLMTMGLLATAGFIALLGGFFRGSGPWGVACSFEYMKRNEILNGSLLGMLLENNDAIFIGNALSAVLIFSSSLVFISRLSAPHGLRN
jgi:hypothetical protein